MRLAVALLSITVLLLHPPAAGAAWVEDGKLIAGAPDWEDAVAAIPDDEGGAFFAWMDLSTGDYDIFAQRVAPDGTEMWGPGGIVVCDAAGDQRLPRLAPDGIGGFAIIWDDDRARTDNRDIYAQRLTANGAAMWASNGVGICTAADNQSFPIVHFDGSAFLVAWQDLRAGLSDIYVQRVGLNGSDLWATDGVAAVNLTGSTQSGPDITSDGQGGAIVGWHDQRSGFHVYVQSINFLGTPAWQTGGIPVDAGGSQVSLELLEDGAGGVLIGYREDGYGAQSDVNVQRRDAAGTELWTITMTDPASDQNFFSTATDGAGGVIVAYSDNRDDFGDIYAQRVTGQGVVLWTQHGIPVSVVSPHAQSDPSIVPDGIGGAVVVWDDNRFQDTDIYAQRVNDYGQAQWSTNGVPVTTAPNPQENFALAGTEAGGAYVVWTDRRSGDRNVHAQRLEPDFGAWGHPEPAIASVTDDPDDQGGDVDVSWLASERDAFQHPEVTHYSVWRAVNSLPTVSMTPVTLAEVTKDFNAPAVRVERTAAQDYYWELVGTQTALRAPGYSYLAATRDDSTGADPAVHHFQVVAHTSNTNVFYVSDPASGYSVDNLAPTAPIMLVAERVGNYVRLDWEPGTDEDEPDFDTYAVYRATTSAVSPEPDFFVDSTADTTLWDPDVTPSGQYYYIVTAIDTHDNESEPSNQASVGGTVTGIGGDTPALTALTARANYPNPFGATTELRIGLPGEADVHVTVYDVRGRRVAELARPALAAGWRAIPFDGRDTDGALLPSGVYFYRVRAAGETVTRKLVIQR